MMLRSVILTVVLAVFTGLPCAANAELVCEADIVSLDFGMISVRDGYTQQTSGPITISCAGGPPGETVQACVTIGSGSGGGVSGHGRRYLAGNGTGNLEYQLTAQNTFSGGGTPWETVGYAVALDASGSSTIAPTLYAEVTSIGKQATIGSYRSSFAAGADVQMSFGETDCNQSGVASSFAIDAIVTASCTVSVSNMDFGVIDAGVVAPVDQTATISVACTNASGYSVGLGFGAQPVDFSPTGRRMANGGNLLAYGLYHDAARSSDWGLNPGTVATGEGTGSDQSLTVFGRIFPNQDAAVGVYADTVVVIVTY